MVKSSAAALKGIIVNVLKSEEMMSADARQIAGILRRLAAQDISPEKASAEIDDVAPGLGSRVLDAIKRNGLVVVPLLVSAVALYATFEANSIAREANDISRATLEHAIEQAAEKAVSQEHVPTSRTQQQVPDKAGVKDARPHHSIRKNRKLRRAEQAKKRRTK